MPCYQVSTISVEFRAENQQLLERAAQALGGVVNGVRLGTVTVTLPQGAVSIKDGKATGRAEAVNGLRVQYAKEAVKQAQEWAKSKGWQTQRVSDNKLRVFRGK